ncbi:MAG: hypothetical protein ACKPCM_04445 [Pseudanabaena sp.]
MILFAYGLRYYLRLPNDSPMQSPDHLDAYEVAYLFDGNKRVFDTAISSLFQKGYLRSCTIQERGCQESKSMKKRA